MSDHQDTDLAALVQVEELLEAYAEARLTPAGPLLARMRAAVVAQAATSAAVAAERHHLDADRATRTPWSLSSLHVPRRAFALGLAATLALGTSAAVLAARPGSPLYDARVAIEGALLPNDLNARLAAHEGHLNTRIAEAQAAAARGDGAAIAAALAAYRSEVDVAVVEIGDDPDRLALLEAVLGQHVALLKALEAQAPSDASIGQALDASQSAVDKLTDKTSHQGGKPSPAPHATRAPSTDGGVVPTNESQGGGGGGQP